MKRNILLIFIVLCLSTVGASAQQGQVILQVSGTENVPLVNATVKVYTVADRHLLQATVTDDEGKAVINSFKDSTLLEVSYLGYVASLKGIGPSTAKILAVTLIQIDKQLNEIVIKGNRPFIQQDFGKLTININGDVKAGINAVDVLRKVPGTLVSDQGVNVEGQPVTIYIDNKPTLLSGKDLINMLSGMTSDMLNKMEVIYNPSSKYEAAGQGGIINISTIKRTKPGYNGSVNVTAGYGWKYPLSNTGVNFSYRKEKVNVYSSYNISAGKSYQQVTTTRNLPFQRIADSSVIKSPYLSNNLRVGFDYYADKQNTFGILVTGYDNNNRPLFNTNSFNMTGASTKVDSINAFNNQNTTNSVGGNLNLNFRHQYDTLGKKTLTMDIDAGRFHFDGKNDVRQNSVIGAFQGPVLSEFQHSLANTSIYSFKTDFSQTFKHSLLETGVKASYADINNNFASNIGLPVVNNDSHFLYDEAILAGYINFQFQFGKNTLQTGLRAEETSSKGNAVEIKNVVKRDYFDLFPSLNYEHKFKGATLSAGYSRRIGRPNYAYLNPFVTVRSAYYVSTGNPYLSPSFTDYYRVGLTIKKLSFAASYSRGSDVINDLEVQNDTTKVITNTKSNLSSSDIYRVSASYYNSIFKIVQINYSTGYNYSRFLFLYNVQNVDVHQDGVYLTLDNNITLPKKWYLDLFYYYQSKITYGNRIDLPIWNINLSGGKEIFKGQGNISFSANDIFFTNITRSEAHYANLDLFLRSQYDSRSFRLNLSYKFGKSKNDYRKRFSGSADEQRRSQ